MRGNVAPSRPLEQIALSGRRRHGRLLRRGTRRGRSGRGRGSGPRAVDHRLAADPRLALEVAELAEPFEMSQPAISKHLKVLEKAGLVLGDQTVVDLEDVDRQAALRPLDGRDPAVEAFVRSDPRFTEFRLHIWHQLHTARPSGLRAPREVA